METGSRVAPLEKSSPPRMNSGGATACKPGRVPLFVDAAADLAAKPGGTLGSWYVNCAFESRGRTLGFVWHQGFPAQSSTTKLLLMNATDGRFVPHIRSEPLGDKVGASLSTCNVTSSLGSLSGDRSRLILKVRAGSEALDIVLTPQREELYNGALGVLPLFGTQSFEYAFPNVIAKGTMTLDGVVYEVDSSAAWFDRQWGPLEIIDPAAAGKSTSVDLSRLSWTWLGLTLDPAGRESISFWDVHEPSGQRDTFLTYRRADGVHMVLAAGVGYDRIWTSEETGQQYPGLTRITAPEIDLDIEVRMLLSRQEFVNRLGEAQSGCQALCRATGRFGAAVIAKAVIFEMIGSPGAQDR